MCRDVNDQQCVGMCPFPVLGVETTPPSWPTEAYFRTAEQRVHGSVGGLRRTAYVMREEVRATHVDVICIDVVICAFQNDPRCVVYKQKRRERKEWSVKWWVNSINTD